jgi:hypothetical protein
MSFRDEVDDAIKHVVSIRQLVLLSRRTLTTDKLSLEKETKRKEALEMARKNLSDLPAEKVENIAAYSVSISPIEIDEIIHKLERAEFLLEDIKKGRDKRTNLKTLADSFRITPVIHEGLMSAGNLVKIMEAR